jgi:hypothetical protein
MFLLIVILDVILLSGLLPSLILVHGSLRECHFVKYHFTECFSASIIFHKFILLCFILLNAILRFVILMNFQSIRRYHGVCPCLKYYSAEFHSEI